MKEKNEIITQAVTIVWAKEGKEVTGMQLAFLPDTKDADASQGLTMMSEENVRTLIRMLEVALGNADECLKSKSGTDKDVIELIKKTTSKKGGKR